LLSETVGSFGHEVSGYLDDEHWRELERLIDAALDSVAEHG